MNVSHSLLAAAVGGILMGATGCGGSQPEPATEATPAAAQPGAAEPAAAAPAAAESTPMPASEGAKHACKGQNDCKGQGGCKTDKHACKGQNDCKGQGGCKG